MAGTREARATQVLRTPPPWTLLEVLTKRSSITGEAWGGVLVSLECDDRVARARLLVTGATIRQSRRVRAVHIVSASVFVWALVFVGLFPSAGLRNASLAASILVLTIDVVVGVLRWQNTYITDFENRRILWWGERLGGRIIDPQTLEFVRSCHDVRD